MCEPDYATLFCCSFLPRESSPIRPCRSQSVGPENAIAAILQATYQALTAIAGHAWAGALAASQAARPPPIDSKVFTAVWLALAGVTNDADIAAFLPYARKAFGVTEGHGASLRLTNGTPPWRTRYRSTDPADEYW